MTKIGRTTFAAAFAAGVVLAAGPAIAADLADLKTDIEGGQVVAVLDDTETSVKYIPKGGEPTDEFPDSEPQIGDAFAFTDDLRQDGELVGTDVGRCVVQPENAINCEATLTLAGGTITAGGPVDEGEDESAPSVVPLIGGTGDYAGIKGTLTIQDHSDEDDPTDTLSTLTLRYLLPAEATQVGAVPAGGAETGGGLGDPGASIAIFAIAAAAIVTGSGIAGLGRRLRDN